jgi:hypothetical protein
LLVVAFLLLNQGRHNADSAFLAGQAFDPETIRDMSLAFEKVCEALSLKMVHDAATRLVAEKIIKLAQWRVRDVTSLTAMTLKEFKGGD